MRTRPVRLFNALDHPIVFARPRRVTGLSMWREHIPFGLLAIDLLRPRVLVELGTHEGDSYCAFCQAVQELGTETRCYAIDHWRGDPQTGFYGPEVLADLRAHHDPLYGGFSRLVESEFDAALALFSDGTVDLLHIDGFHEYDAVRHDFEAWLPKLSERGAILFHDTNYRARGFEVWRLWEQVAREFPSFEFLHSHGLGVLAVGDDVPPPLLEFLEAANDQPAAVRQFFSALGESIRLARELADGREAAGAVKRELSEARAERAALEEARADAAAENEWIRRERDRLEERVASLGERLAGAQHGERELRRRVAEGDRAQAHLDALVHTKTFRFSAPARGVYSRILKLRAARNGPLRELAAVPAPAAVRAVWRRESRDSAALLPGAARRVLVVSPDLLPLPGLPTVGSGLRAWALGQGLRAAGHDVVFSMPRPALERFPDAVPSDVMDASWEICNIDATVARVAPDVVLISGWANVGQLTEELQHATPLVLDQHGPHILEREHQGYKDLRSNAAEKLDALRRADFFTCAGWRQLAYFKVWLQLAGWSERDREERVAAIPVSLSPELPARAPRREPTFVYGGVFLPWQDPKRSLLALVDELERRGEGRLQLFGGEHPWLPMPPGIFDELIRRLDESPRVRRLETVPHEILIGAYTRAHVAIDLMRRNAERELAFTTRTVEYLWCGLPVIYNDYAELAGHIREYDAGWTLDPEDEAGLRRVVGEILGDPGGVEHKSRNAQRLVRERLSWDRTIASLEAFLREPTLRSGDGDGHVSVRPEPVQAAR